MTKPTAAELGLNPLLTSTPSPELVAMHLELLRKPSVQADARAVESIRKALQFWGVDPDAPATEEIAWPPQ